MEWDIEYGDIHNLKRKWSVIRQVCTLKKGWMWIFDICHTQDKVQRVQFNKISGTASTHKNNGMNVNIRYMSHPGESTKSTK